MFQPMPAGARPAAELIHGYTAIAQTIPKNKSNTILLLTTKNGKNGSKSIPPSDDVVIAVCGHHAQ
jgi:hypothetical protein